jgi:hypothetical protein
MEHTQILPAEPSPSALAAFLLAQPRASLEALTEALVATLDVQDAPDVEDEPDFRPRSDGLPGDLDDHESAGDERDAAWIEWERLPAARKKAHNHIGGDTEDDELAGDETDGNCAEDEEGFHTAYGGGPGCEISDPGGYDEGY